VDSFKALREEREETDKDIRFKCFVCGINRDVFDSRITSTGGKTGNDTMSCVLGADGAPRAGPGVPRVCGSSREHSSMAPLPLPPFLPNTPFLSITPFLPIIILVYR
jgi:hypothetical protein